MSRKSNIHAQSLQGKRNGIGLFPLFQQPGYICGIRDKIVNEKASKKIVQIYTQWMFNALTITGVSNQTCGAKAWYAQTCTHALPVRTVSVDLTIPGPKYWKPTKMRVSTQFVGELNAPQASKT